MWVTKERLKGKWFNTFFDDETGAKKLALKIIQAGGKAVWMKAAY